MTVGQWGKKKVKNKTQAHGVHQETSLMAQNEADTLFPRI